MTINEMFDELENKVRDTYIVTLKYKYDFEEKYTIENHILEYDSKADSYVWQNDWNEGQTNVEVLGYMLLGDVDTAKLKPCGDCISRAKALEMLGDEPENWTDTEKEIQEVNDYRWFKSILEDLPPVTPQPKMGKWIDVESLDGTLWHDCSECGETEFYATNYCPNCGAEMEGEEC
jgi:hypothetical protein